jgi:hypothetical protein
MTTLRVLDTDGRPFFIVAASHALAERHERRLRAKAKAHGCHMREVPGLGSTDRGPWCKDFDVTYTNGVITAIRESGPAS